MREARLGRDRTADLRGTYDRALTPAQRSERQRERLMRACAACLAEGTAPTIEAVTARAGTARNTLYLHYAGAEDVVDAVVHRAARVAAERLAVAIDAEATPIAAARACARAWIQLLLQDVVVAQALRALPWTRTTGVRRSVESAVDACVAMARAHGLTSRGPDPEGTAVCSGALIALGWFALDATEPRRAAEDRWADLVVHTFR